VRTGVTTLLTIGSFGNNNSKYLQNAPPPMI
jgi:hypothetical protein